ncbi:hypothetical protein [Chachezhania sediminis]|uniref:hypothetical protein n=1 Tax=Chachezhania sediminis TaxID=2599291 RepID=UPI00131A641E|nr:hypothetical protein [Chachezhania sediminis]
MSAPDTNVDREARRHKPALVGIFAALGAIVALILAVGLFASSSDVGDNDATPAVAPGTSTAGG